jgi:hypothetical protein
MRKAKRRLAGYHTTHATGGGAGPAGRRTPTHVACSVLVRGAPLLAAAMHSLRAPRAIRYVRPPIDGSSAPRRPFRCRGRVARHGDGERWRLARRAHVRTHAPEPGRGSQAGGERGRGASPPACPAAQVVRCMARALLPRRLARTTWHPGRGAAA